MNLRLGTVAAGQQYLADTDVKAQGVLSPAVLYTLRNGDGLLHGGVIGRHGFGTGRHGHPACALYHCQRIVRWPEGLRKVRSSIPASLWLAGIFKSGDVYA